MKGLTITNTTDDIVEILLEHNESTEIPYGVLPRHSIQIGDIDPSKSVVVRTRNDGWPAFMSGAAPDLIHLNLEAYVRNVLRVVVEKLGDRVDGIEERVANLVAGVERDQGLAENVERTLCERIEKLEKALEDIRQRRVAAPTRGASDRCSPLGPARPGTPWIPIPQPQSDGFSFPHTVMCESEGEEAKP